MTVASLLANSRGSSRLGGTAAAGASGAGITAAAAGGGGGGGDHNVVFHLRRGQQHQQQHHHGRGGGAYSASSYHALPCGLHNNSSSTTCWRVLIAASVVAVLHVSRQQQRSMSEFARAHEEIEHRFFGGISSGSVVDPQRCVEDESILLSLPDSPSSSTNATASPASISSTTSSTSSSWCRCPDPLVPLPKKLPQWVHRHSELEAMAQNAALDGVEVVILGDSIVERFAGTRNMGRLPRAEDDGSTHDADDDKEEALSTQARSYAALRSKLNMVALGCSGDTTNHLLYHLAHGVLHPKLQPKVIVLVIGTNNLGAQAGCNARTTLAGVLQVAQFLHRERPRATIVLHALLPRTDADGEDGPLHRYWSQILWINLQLKKFSALHPDWRFMNPNSKLLRPDPDAPYKVALKPGFMPDGLHPSPEGYEIWSHELVKVVTSALDGHDNDEKSQDEKKRDRKDSGRPKGKSRRRRGESR